MHHHQLAGITPTFAIGGILAVLGACGGGGGGGSSSQPDRIAPTATVTLDRSAGLRGEVVVATIAASEAVSGLVSGDLTVTNGTIEGLLSVDAATYQAVVRLTTVGTCQITLPTGVCTDLAGNALASGGSGSITVINTSTSWASATGVNAAGKPYGDLVVGAATLRFIWIEPGTFVQGSPTSELSRGTDEAQRTVTLTHGFWVSETEVPNAFWNAAAPSYPSGVVIPNDNKPVSAVSVDDIDGFLPRLGTAVGVGAPNFRLLTEAEWEYAARAGTTTPFSFSSTPDTTQVNCQPNDADLYIPLASNSYRNAKVDAGSLPANPWGLFEMHGNVWEVCLDWYKPAYASGPIVDPLGSSTGASGRVVRGGGFNSFGRTIRSANRGVAADLTARGILYVGFRLAFSGDGSAPSSGG